MWTEIHREIITPRPGLASAPRILEGCGEISPSSSEDTDSDSESSSQATISEPAETPDPKNTPAGDESQQMPVAARRLLPADVTTYARMTALADEAEESACRLTTSLDETLGEGRRLLLFLGQKLPAISADGAAPSEVGGSVRAVFDTVSKFTHLLKGAVADVEKFQKRQTSKTSTAAQSSNYGFYRRRKNSVSQTASKVSEMERCKQMAHDSILRAVTRACQMDGPVRPATRRKSHVPGPLPEQAEQAVASHSLDQLD